MRIRVSFPTLVCGSMSFFATVTAQQAVTPPPRPPDSAPTLAATLDFIREKLDDAGPVKYTSVWGDVAGNSHEDHYTVTLGPVTADAAACTIRYGWNITQETSPYVNRELWIPLKEVKSIRSCH